MVIPALDEEEELAGTLRSVRTVFGSEVEIIVADGGSRDGTAGVVTGSARLVRSAPGRGRQLNAGAEAARGDVLLFLHADTHPAPGSAAALAAALADQRVVGGCFRIALRGPSADRPIARLLAAAINLRSRALRTATGDQAIFARRSVLTRLGGFPDQELFEDVALYRKLRRAGRVVVLPPAVRTSDRRWRREGYLRTIALHLALRLLFALGVPDRRLASLYLKRSG